jgi:hypothetical protein
MPRTATEWGRYHIGWPFPLQGAVFATFEPVAKLLQSRMRRVAGLAGLSLGLGAGVGIYAAAKFGFKVI